MLPSPGLPCEQATPYFAWRPVFAGLFGLDHAAPARGVERDQVLARLGPEPELERVAPLLNAVLSLNLPDNDLTTEMSGEVRAGNTIDLLVRLLMLSRAYFNGVSGLAPTRGPVLDELLSLLGFRHDPGKVGPFVHDGLASLRCSWRGQPAEQSAVPRSCSRSR